MGNDCASMCVNDEGQRSLQPQNQIKHSSPANPLPLPDKQNGNSFLPPREEPTRGGPLNAAESSRIVKTGDKVV